MPLKNGGEYSLPGRITIGRKIAAHGADFLPLAQEQTTTGTRKLDGFTI